MSPRLITAMLPFTDAGKSFGRPKPQRTYVPLASPSGEPFNGNASRTVLAPSVMSVARTSPSGIVERTPTPGATTDRDPRFSHTAAVPFVSSAPIGMTPGYPAG